MLSFNHFFGDVTGVSALSKDPSLVTISATKKILIEIVESANDPKKNPIFDRDL